MRLKIERQMTPDDDWSTVGIIDPETEYRRSEHPVGSAFCKWGEVGDMLTLHDGWRYTLLLDAVTRKVLRCTYENGNQHDYPHPTDIMHNGVSVSTFFARGDAMVGDYVETTVRMAGSRPATFRYELVEVEDES